jgi:hypothetical protein
MGATRRRFASLSLLSIVIPISLLATFRLTGIIPEPPKPQTITVEVVSWNMSRPAVHDKGIVIGQWVNNSLNQDGASVNFSLLICAYVDNIPRFSENVDYVDFGIFVDADLTEGFVQSVFVEFSGIDTQAYLDIVSALDDPDWVDIHNLEIKSVLDSFSVDQPCIETYGLNQPKTCSLEMRACWYFLDRNNIDHAMIASLKILVFDGTRYLEVIVPITLGVFAS